MNQQSLFASHAVLRRLQLKVWGVIAQIVFGFVCLVCSSNGLYAEVIRASVTTEVYGPSGRETFSYNDPLSAVGGNMRTWDKSWNGLFLASAISEASGRSHYGSIGARSFSSDRHSVLEATNHGDGFETRARASYWEEIQIGTLQDRDNFLISTSIPRLNLNFKVHGNLLVEVDKAPDRLGGGVSVAQAGFGVAGYREGFVSLASGRWSVELTESMLSGSAGRGQEQLAVSAVFNAKLDLTNGHGIFLTDLVTIAYARDGAATSNFFNTISLDSVTFDDGTTPESHGYTLRFGSGRTSPNFSSVPEPGSIFLFGLACMSATLVRFRSRFSKPTGTFETIT